MNEDLVEFVRAQFDEDDRTARDAGGGKWGREAYGCVVDAADSRRLIVYSEGTPTREQADHIARWDPAHVVREVAAKRSRIDWLAGLQHDIGTEDFVTCGSCRILAKPGELGDLEVGYCSCGLDAMRDRLYRIEALPYVDRPGYREEWRLG